MHGNLEVRNNIEVRLALACLLDSVFKFATRRFDPNVHRISPSLPDLLVLVRYGIVV